MDKQQKRPIYLNIPKLGSKMSITAKVSILHRASGVLMFVALPFILSIFHKSLTSAEFYSNCYAIASLPVMKIIYTVLIWAIMHHMCAGIRFVLLDMHKGIERTDAQRSARWVMVVSLLLTIALGALIW